MKTKLTIIASLMLFAAGRLYAHPVADTVAKAKYDIVKLEITRLKKQRTIQIYMPPGYSASKKRYPVIYLQDGQNVYNNEAYTTDNWFADSLVNLMPADKQCIIVAIHAGTGSSRTQEYNPYIGLSDGAIYAAYVVKRVKAYIDTSYRTRPEAKYTAVAGSALGGVISTYIAAKYSNNIGVAGIFSPDLSNAEGIYADMDKQAIPSRCRLFFAYGDMEADEADKVNRLYTIFQHKKLAKANLPTPLVVKGGKANEQQWRSDFEAFYRWFSADW